ncbi:MAG: hypothetical protein ABIL58_10755 [Pseudomonadota bacterium]
MSHIALCDTALPADPAAIRKELRDLRKQTAQNDPNVSARIDQLLKQLQQLQQERDAAESQGRGEARPEADDDKAALTRESNTTERNQEAPVL